MELERLMRSVTDVVEFGELAGKRILSDEEMEKLVGHVQRVLPVLDNALESGSRLDGTAGMIGLLHLIVHLANKMRGVEKNKCGECVFHGSDDGICCYEPPVPGGAERRAGSNRVSCSKFDYSGKV